MRQLSFFPILLWLAVVPVCVAQHAPEAEHTVQQVFEWADPYVVRIETATGFGSGFLLSDESRPWQRRLTGTRWVVTNYHVIKGERKATVTFSTSSSPKEPAYSVREVIAFDETRDFAILEITSNSLWLNYIASGLGLGNSDALKGGERVVAIGNPKGWEHTVSDGLFDAKRQMDGHDMLQITVPIDHGSSGGPLLNMRGEVVGITSEFRPGEVINFYFAVPIHYVTAALRSAGNSQTLDQVADQQESKDREWVTRNFSYYQDPGGVFALTYPKDWLVQRCEIRSPGGKWWFLLKRTVIAPSRAKQLQCSNGKVSEGMLIEVALRQPHTAVDLDDYAKWLLNVFARQPGFRATEPVHAINFAGLGARAWTSEHDTDPGIEQNVNVVASHPPGFELYIESSSPKSRLDGNEVAFKVMLSTFKLLANGR